MHSPTPRGRRTSRRRPRPPGRGASSTSRRRSATGSKPLEQPITLAASDPAGWLELRDLQDRGRAVYRALRPRLTSRSGSQTPTARATSRDHCRPSSTGSPTGKPCFVMDTRRDFIFVDDLVDCVLHAVDGNGTRRLPHLVGLRLRDQGAFRRDAGGARHQARAAGRGAAAQPRRCLHDPARSLAHDRATSAGASARRSRPACSVRSTTTGARHLRRPTPT